MNNTEFQKEMQYVRLLIKTSEKKSNAENYVTSLYASGAITSRQFELLNGIIY